MAAAAAEPDSTKAEPLIDATTQACGSVDEWVAALKKYPAAMGLTERAEIGDLDVEVVCSTVGASEELKASPVCRDAYERGIAE